VSILKTINPEPETSTGSQFCILFRFSLSENITSVRVSKRKSWTSTLAEILAFIAGLSFQAKIVKYIGTINHIFRFYDRLYKQMLLEERTPIIEQLQNDQDFNSQELQSIISPRSGKESSQGSSLANLPTSRKVYKNASSNTREWE